MNFLRALPLAFFIGMIFIMMLTTPIDRTPLAGSDVEKMALDSIRTAPVLQWANQNQPYVAFGRVNITPANKMPMAGYVRRPSFENVHDSLYVHLILIEKENLDLFLISADLLIFPSSIRDLLKASTGQLPNTRVYLSASHTHNGLGGWAAGFGGELIAGEYHPEWVKAVSESILSEMEAMRNRTVRSELKYFQSDASEFVKNRLSEGSPVDGMIRGIKIFRENRDSLVLFSYSGHPTLLERSSLDLSNDYPAATVSKLEQSGYAFGMFMAGMVGSHRITNIQGDNYEKIEALSDILANRIISSGGHPLNVSEIRAIDFEIPFGPSQVRLLESLAVRDWLFSWVLQPLEGTVSAYRLGDLYLVNTPCDFSGELFSGIGDQYKPMIITSFNGDYIGYITADQHYDSSTYMEVRTMNWVGPHYGGHFQNLINQSVNRID